MGMENPLIRRNGYLHMTVGVSIKEREIQKLIGIKFLGHEEARL